jgi:type VI protein secretion system component VasK
VSSHHPDPKPLDVDGVLAVSIGTIAWAVAFLVLLPFRDQLAEEGREWWLWTCLVGAVLGLAGLWYCVRRRNAIRRDGKRAAEEAAKTLREPLS